MATSSIISFGFGNGTFSPGVGKLPTLGYSSGSFIEGGCWTEGRACHPGYQCGELFHPGFQQGEEYIPGFQQAQGGC